jgi:hypothetical protein
VEGEATGRSIGFRGRVGSLGVFLGHRLGLVEVRR